MQRIKVKKQELLEKVEENRRTHEEQVTLATKRYRDAAIKQLLERYQQVMDGGKVDLRFDLDEPQSHLDDYDTAIAMLKMSIPDEIDLEEHEFRELVLDQWTWRGRWKMSMRAYGVD